MSEWQPIETAPKDGSEILLGRSSNTKVYTAHWELEPSWAWKSAEPCWAVYMASDDYYSTYLHADWPSHWMPLPEPPNE